MSDLTADVGAYLQTAALDVPPPLIDSDPLVSGTSPIERLLRILGLAANADDPEDYAESINHHAAREAKATEAAEKFAAQDHSAAAQVSQIASGAIGAALGALGSAVQSLAQFPQQFGQATAQALQTGLGAFGDAPTPLHPGGEFGDYLADDFDPFVDDADNRTGYPPGIDRFGAGSPEVPEGLYATAPMASLGPPAPPGATPARPPAASLRSAWPAPSAPGAGMAGMPFFPPAAKAAASNEKEGQTDTKRISVPPVRNGAPVQGRITALPPQPGSMTPHGTPPATRRIVSAPPVGDVS